MKFVNVISTKSNRYKFYSLQKNFVQNPFPQTNE